MTTQPPSDVAKELANPFKNPPYAGWRPYCLMCRSMARMARRDYGYQCIACKNKINHEGVHHD